MDGVYNFCAAATAAATAVGIVGLIVWGANSCALQETALREQCIRAGGSVVGAANGGSHCIRGGPSKGEP